MMSLSFTCKLYLHLLYSQLIAGFSKPTSGSIHVQRYGDDGHPLGSPKNLDSNKVGFVFQFPERY